MLIKYRDDRYSMGHMALFPFLKAGFGISYNALGFAKCKAFWRT